MKKISFFILGMMLALSGFSQSIKSYVITSAGTAMMSGEGAIYLSIGEPMNTEISEGDIMISQGFLNVTISGITADEDLLTEVIKAYPNPASAQMQIEIPEKNGEYVYQLLDMNGKLIRQDSLDDFNNVVELQDVIQGTYFMKVVKDDKSSKTLKIVKL